MFTPQSVQASLNTILPKVQKPGRYTGGEYNQVIKDWDKIPTRVILAFPDIYDLGMSNLGLAILYDQVNRRADALAERVYLPASDMEEAMRSWQLPLYALESKHLVKNFDILGITLPYESLYTNALNLLDLAGIPHFAHERQDQYPLVIAGGHAVFNPEPMADFIDVFVIGEGEEVIHEIIDTYSAWRLRSSSRQDLLSTLAKLSGVYVPSLYQAYYEPDGRFHRLEKLTPEVPDKIIKRIVPVLPPPPTRFLVPYIETVHDRASIEIMRGCTRGCRFCHAGMVTRPVRERPVQEVLDAIQSILTNTGFEEIGLLSLSSSDYSHLVDLVRILSERYANEHLSISLPSLRIESTSVNLMDALMKTRKGGFTLAPEAATERMREIINKPVSTDQLMQTVHEIYSRGWTTIKLYYMIGHPRETIEDVQAIADLCKTIIKIGRNAIGKRAQLNVGVSTFIPKPHTPFQWVSCDSIEQIRAKLDLLKQQLRPKDIKMTWTNPDETMLEAWLSRGDRRLAKVIYLAWKNGAKFDAWQDKFNFKAWLNAFEAVGIDPQFYTHRGRSPDENLPWDHIQTGVSKKFLLEDYRWSQQNKVRKDCRQQCYACGILPTFLEISRQVPKDSWKCPQ